MNFYHLSGKRWSALLVCLLSLLMLASLCITAGAANTDTLYHTMENLLTLDPNALSDTDISNKKGAIGDTDFSWELSSGGTAIAEQALGDYEGNTFCFTGGLLLVQEATATLQNNHAVAISADIYFEALPSNINGAYSPDPNDSNFKPQLIMSWVGNSSTNTTMYDGIRMDSEGYLYLDGKATKINYQISLGQWYNFKIIYSDYTKAEIWVNGERIATMACQARKTSTWVQFFDGNSGLTAHVKNIEIAASKDTYYLGTVKEHSSDFISYQTTMPDANGNFKLRVLAGINSLKYDSFGYRVLLLTKNADGSVNTIEKTGTDTKAYSSVLGGGTEYSIKDHFGYDYACLATIEGLDSTKDFFELVIFPYTLSGGNKIYGNAISLTYTNDSKDGYPVLNVIDDTSYTEIKVSEDTTIYRTLSTPLGGETTLYAYNNAGPRQDSYRAAYFKFTISAAELEKATNAYLRIHSYGTQGTGTPKNLCVYGATTNWSEATLTHSTFYQTLSTVSNARGDKLATITPEEYQSGNFFTVDVLSYIKTQVEGQTPDANGMYTVAFCVTNPDDSGSNTDVVYLSSRERDGNYAANIRFEYSLYGRSFSNIKANNKGNEPIAYAEKLLDEWFGVNGKGGLYDEIYPKDENGNLLTYDIDDLEPNGYGTTNTTGEGDFLKPIMWEDGFLWVRTDSISGNNWKKNNEWNTDRFSRTLSTLGISAANEFLWSDYAKTKTEYDIYGGIENAGIKGVEQNPYFHIEFINGRPYIIDPEGNPFFAVSINAFVYGENANLQGYSEDVYGSEAKFFEDMTKELQDMGIYTTFASDPDIILDVENGLSTTIPINGVSAYMATLGRSQVAEGEFPYNNTINVFDPDFVTTTNETNKTLIDEGGYATNPRVLGYTADNELPSHGNILESYLTLDPTIPDNTFSYHTAWEWFARRTNNLNPTIMDYYNSAEKATLNSEFLGFIYARNYQTVKGSIRKVDPYHMYMGSRVAGECRYDINYLKAAGYYLDVITTNLYDGLNPAPAVMTNYYRYAGIPFIVTEFYAKAMDAIDANGYMLANSTGAGFVVMRQQERANYYEHFVLSLLESKACVGWSWYRFRDNDQGLWATTDGSHTNLRMLFVNYGNPTYPVTYAGPNAKADGNGIYTNTSLGITNWQTDLIETYKGEPMASNQNCNKGLFNTDYSTTVAVYTYDASGNNLTGVESYEVLTVNGSEEFKAEDFVNGAELTVKLAGYDLAEDKTGLTKTLTFNSAIDSETHSKTTLTTYKGKYIALTDSIKTISDSIIGIVNYLDADQHK